MSQTVEKGKTLLVDGPASVTILSGEVEVFGSLLRSSSKIVIREGKRLPFAVKETAAFNVSMGEGSSVEEFNGDTIPQSWIKAFEELLSIQSKPVTAMVLGNVDSGKSSFCTYLINGLLREKRKVAILDGDLGQSDIGPPCSVAYTFVSKPVTDLFNLVAKNASFVGFTSPSPAINKVIESMSILKKEILDGNPDFIIINTDGWVEGEDAISYKTQLIMELAPDIIFCIQQKDELLPFFNIVGNLKLTVESPQAIKQRDREKRKNLRELGYIKYLRNAKVQSIPISWIKIEDDLLGLDKAYEDTKQAKKIYEILEMKPLHFAELKDKVCVVIGKSRWISKEKIKKVEEFTQKPLILFHKGDEEGLLLALYNNQRKFLGIGTLREIDFLRKTLKINTPVSKDIAIVVFGKIKLDKNLREVPVSEEKSFII